MKTIETRASVTDDRQLNVSVQVPDDVSPGEHRVVVVIDDNASRENGAPGDIAWPVHDAGLVPPDRSLTREDIYGDAGR